MEVDATPSKKRLHDEAFEGDGDVDETAHTYKMAKIFMNNYGKPLHQCNPRSANTTLQLQAIKSTRRVFKNSSKSRA